MIVSSESVVKHTTKSSSDVDSQQSQTTMTRQKLICTFVQRIDITHFDYHDLCTHNTIVYFHIQFIFVYF